MSSVTLDLHMHTTLSPCADRGMTPLAVAARAKEQGLGLIALCDHDMVGATEVWRTESEQTDLVVLDGVEITTLEQAHLLGIFPNFQAARKTASKLGLGIYESGKKLDAGPSRPSLADSVNAIHASGGIAIAAHVDRPSSGLLARLGGIPEGVVLDALELSPLGVARAQQLDLERFGLPIVIGSDAHDLSEIGQAFSCLPMKQPCFDELGIALRERYGRRCDCA